jgi:hypothetical protein
MRIGIRPNCQCRIWWKPWVAVAFLEYPKPEPWLKSWSNSGPSQEETPRSSRPSCGKAGDVHGILEAFKMLKVPDTVAVNVFMDSCCRRNQEKLATKAFDAYIRKKSLVPDVISYSVEIGSCLKGASAESRKRARALYQEMKCSRKIQPDNGLIDVVLEAMVRHTASHTLEKIDVQFIDCVIKDAEALDWSSGQLDRWKRAVRALLADRN